MENLPANSVRLGHPFDHSGVDNADPYMISATPGNVQVSYKVYICLFVCLAMKAVHLEDVSWYDAQPFIAAFRWSVSCRGHCKVLRSDRGTTFVRPDKELKHLFKN